MRRELAIPLAALVAACSPPSSDGSSDRASDSASDARTERTTRVAAAPRAVGETTESGLAFFHLAQSGEGRVEFGSSTREGDFQVFSDVLFEGEDGVEIRAGELRIAGARETAEGSLFDRLEILDLVGSDSGDEFTVDRILVEDPNPLVARFIAQALSDEGVDEDADWGEFTDYAFRTFAIEGFEADADDGAFSLDELRLSDLSSGVLGGFAFEGLRGSGDADGSQVTFELGSWTMNGLDLSGADAFSERDVDDPEELQAALFESGFNDPFRKHYDDYALEDVRFDVDGVIVALASFEGSARQTRVGVETEDVLDGLVVEFDGKRGLGAQALQMLSFLDYDRIELNGRFVQTANQVEDRLTTDEYSITASDAFALELDYDIGGVRAYMENVADTGLDFSADMGPDAMAELLGPLLVHGFELRLVDDSIVERALAAAAQMQGQTPDQVREQAIAIMTVGTMMVPPGPVQALALESIGAAGDFLTEPGTLRVTLSPDRPVALGDLLAALETEDYDAAVGLLNIEVEAE